MLSFLRLSFFLCSVVVGAGSILYSLTLVIYYSWEYSYKALADHHMFYGIIPSPYPLEAMLIITSYLLALIFATNLLIFPFSSRVKALRRLVDPGNLKELGNSSTLKLNLKRVCNRMNTSVPRIYTTVNPNILAFAHEYPFRESIVIGDTLIKALGEGSNEMAWVLAHEMSHLKRNDSLVGGLAMVSNSTFNVLFRLRTFLFNILIKIANFFRVPVWVFGIISLPIRVFFKVTYWSFLLSKKFFMLSDAIVGRRMEYRADREATIAIGAQPGIRVLTMLKGTALEPSFNIFATHPSTTKRVERVANNKKAFDKN